MKASDLFVKCLENEGVKYIFGIPGEENLDFIESIRKSSIKFIVTRHEQAAGFMAATYGRLTGIAGVCLSTLGPGSTNLVTAVAYTQLGGIPVVFITGQKPIKKSKQGHFQIINTVEMMRPITKYSQSIVHSQSIPAQVRQAFKLAEEERPGSVHLELPEDIAEEETDAEIIHVSKVRRPIAEEKAVGNAVDMIETAKRPLLLVGAGANRKRASNMLTFFVEKTGIPFFNTQMGKGVISERHDLYLGTAALSENDYLHCAIDRADLIINVGHDTVEKPPFIMRNDGKKVIHINFSSAHIDPIYFPHLEVVGDIANAVWQIGCKIKKQKTWDFVYYRKLKKLLDNHIKSHIGQNRFPYPPQQIVADVRDSMGDEDIVTLDNGMFKIWFTRNYPTYVPNTLLVDNALATMGAGLPAAICAKMIFPQKKVIAVCGDGGFMMNSQEFETAVRHKLDLVVLLLNDNGFGMIKWKQKAMGFPDFALDFANPDFVKYAQSYGAYGHRVKKHNELKEVIKKAQKAGGVHLIDVPLDYSDNVKILINELMAKTCIL